MDYSDLQLKLNDKIISLNYLGQFEIEKGNNLLSICTKQTKNNVQETITVLPDELRLKLQQPYFNTKNLIDLWHKPGIYAFVIPGSDISYKYIGRASNSVIQRLKGYLSPGPTQGTNALVNDLIFKSLKNGKTVLLYFYPEEDTEKELQRLLKPEWNREVPR